MADLTGGDIAQGSGARIHASSQPSVQTDVSGWVVVTLHGEQDMLEAERSRAVLRDGLTASGGRVVVDLSEVTFGDSSLLGALVGAAKVALGHSRKVRVVTSDERMTRKLQITGLDQVFRIFPTLSDALQGLS